MQGKLKNNYNRVCLIIMDIDLPIKRMKKVNKNACAL
jgi:hypothetical protein